MALRAVSPSAATRMCVPIIALFPALTAKPLPVSPQCTMFFEKVLSMAFPYVAKGTESSGAPSMHVRVPASAP